MHFSPKSWAAPVVGGSTLDNLILLCNEDIGEINPDELLSHDSVGDSDISLSVLLGDLISFSKKGDVGGDMDFLNQSVVVIDPVGERIGLLLLSFETFTSSFFVAFSNPGNGFLFVDLVEGISVETRGLSSLCVYWHILVNRLKLLSW